MYVINDTGATISFFSGYLLFSRLKIQSILNRFSNPYSW